MTYTTQQKAADLGTVVATTCVAAMMALLGNAIAVVGLGVFVVAGVGRYLSEPVRNWTDDHQWVFLVVLLVAFLVAVFDAMP